MVAKYQVIGSLLRRRLLSLALGDEEVMASGIQPITMGAFLCAGVCCQQRFSFQTQIITKAVLQPL